MFSRSKTTFLFERCVYKLRPYIFAILNFIRLNVATRTALQVDTGKRMEFEEESNDAPPSKKRRYCCHCSNYVGYSTYYRHRDEFFDPVSEQWTMESSVTNESAVLRTDEFSASELSFSDTEDFSAAELCSQGFVGLLPDAGWLVMYSYKWLNHS